jgi:integrase
MRTLTWNCVDLDRELWIIPKHKTINQQNEPLPRIVPLHPLVCQICRRLAKRSHSPNDYVFLNMHGQSYKKDTLVTKMARLR